MLRAVAEACRVDEIKLIYNATAALRECARRAGNLKLQHQIAEIQLRAGRRAGELLRAMRKRGEIGPGITKQDRCRRARHSICRALEDHVQSVQ